MMYASANLCKQNKWHTHSIVSARFEAKNAGQISSQKTNIFMKKKQPTPSLIYQTESCKRKKQEQT